VEHWDRTDWSGLWWVRAHLRLEVNPDDVRDAMLADRLAQRFDQYRSAPFDRLLVLRVVSVTGWAAEAHGGLDITG
jgi:hypothetical protein